MKVETKAVEPFKTRGRHGQSPSPCRIRHTISTTDQETRDDVIPRTDSSDNSDSSDENISVPAMNDVLCGRGGGMNSHPGNARFRKLVEKRKRIYLTARFKQEKQMIASSIVKEIQDANGRFMSRSCDSGLWRDIGDEKAREKTILALRENAPSLRNKIEKEIKEERAKLKRDLALKIKIKRMSSRSILCRNSNMAICNHDSRANAFAKAQRIESDFGTRDCEYPDVTHSSHHATLYETQSHHYQAHQDHSYSLCQSSGYHTQAPRSTSCRQEVEHQRPAPHGSHRRQIHEDPYQPLPAHIFSRPADKNQSWTKPNYGYNTSSSSAAAAAPAPKSCSSKRKRQPKFHLISDSADLWDILDYPKKRRHSLDSLNGGKRTDFDEDLEPQSLDEDTNMNLMQQVANHLLRDYKQQPTREFYPAPSSQHHHHTYYSADEEAAESSPSHWDIGPEYPLESMRNF